MFKFNNGYVFYGFYEVLSVEVYLEVRWWVGIFIKDYNYNQAGLFQKLYIHKSTIRIANKF